MWNCEYETNRVQPVFLSLSLPHTHKHSEWGILHAKNGWIAWKTIATQTHPKIWNKNVLYSVYNIMRDDRMKARRREKWKETETSLVFRQRQSIIYIARPGICRMPESGSIQYGWSEITCAKNVEFSSSSCCCCRCHCYMYMFFFFGFSFSFHSLVFFIQNRKEP